MTLVTLVMLGSASITLVTFVTSGTVKVHHSHLRVNGEGQVSTAWPRSAESFYLYASDITNRVFTGPERFDKDVIHNHRVVRPSDVFLFWIVADDRLYGVFQSSTPIFTTSNCMHAFTNYTLCLYWLGITKWWYSDHHYCTFMDDMSDDSLWTGNIRALMKAHSVN